MKTLFIIGLALLYLSAGELPSEAFRSFTRPQITVIILGLSLVLIGSWPEIKKTLKEVVER